MPLFALIGGYAIAQISFALAGVRVDAAPLDRLPVDSLWQLLDVSLLRHRLLQSLWYLHSQPPLFNLAVGLLVKVPAALQPAVETTVAMCMGLAMAVASYLLAVDLSVPRWAAAGVVAVFVVANPEYVLFQNWLGWSYPTALVAVVSALCLVRYVRTHRWGYGLGFFSAVSVLVLWDSTYQWEWLFVSVAVGVVAAGRRWRQLVSVAALPLLLVGGWYLKDAVVFGTTTTSSWLGMNLAKMVLVTSSPRVVDRLERRGVLSPLASINPFSEERAYIPRWGRLPRTGIPALDQLRKADGALNFNNLLYVSVSGHYLHEDLAYIRAEPGRYLFDIGMAVQVWQTPGDQYFPASGNSSRIHGYTRDYDRYLLAQPLIDPATPVYPLVRHIPPPLSRLSYGLMVEMALALLGTPFLIWRYGRKDSVFALGLVFIWITVAYSFVVTSLVEVGENERFRFELGSLPLLATTVVVVEIVRAARARGRPEAAG